VHVVRRPGVGSDAGNGDDGTAAADQGRQGLQGDESAAEIDLEDRVRRR